MKLDNETKGTREPSRVSARGAIVKKGNKRLVFALIWSFASVLGCVMYFGVISDFVGYFLGFHLIKDFMTLGVVIGLYWEHAELMFVSLLFAVVFIAVWILSLIKINKSRLFEWLILADNAIALIIYIVFAIINDDYLVFRERIVWLVVQNIVTIIALLCFKKKQQTYNDGSLV